MEHTKQEHPLKQYKENEKVAYLCLLSAVCYVDKSFNDVEKKELDNLLTSLNILDKGKGQIYSAIYSIDKNERIEFIEIIKNLQSSELKFTLISDLCLFAYADDNFSDGEYSYIKDIAKELEVTGEQVDAIRIVQENIRKLKDIPSNSERAKKIIEESAGQLTGAGVSIAAIALTGTTVGLSGPGIVAGLAALGAVVGGGMLAGAVIVVPAITVGTAYGVKKLIDVIWQSTKNKDDGKK